MDDDIAFCLDRFIEDQVQLIEDRLDELKQEETVECRKLEQEKVTANKKKPPPKNKGSHHNDKSLIDQFIQELRDDEANANNSETLPDDPNHIATLKAEISTKLNACKSYLSRLRNVARTVPNSSNFVDACEDLIIYCRQQRDFENNFQQLCNILAESNTDNVTENTQQWWKEKYGNAIGNINIRNKKFNPVITENGFAVLSSRSRVLTNAKKLIEARQSVNVKSEKVEIIRKFVNRLFTMDEDERNQTKREDLIEQLKDNTLEQIIDYTNKWLSKRDEIRNRKEPPDPCM